MRRIDVVAAIAATIWITSLAVGIRASATNAQFTDQEAITATEATGACFTNDAAAPTVSASIISKTTPYHGGFIRQGSAYYVYANISGAATRVTADVRSLTAGEYLVPLTAGSYSLGGVTYGWRSSALTATDPLGGGSYSYSVSPANASLQCRTTPASVTVDNTAPVATDVQPNNRTGGTSGRPETGDPVIFTFSEVIDPETVAAGWTGASMNVVARITDNAGNDLLTVWDQTNTVQLALGSVALAQNYVTTNTTWGASGTASTLVQSGNSITLTLGTLAGTTRQATQNVSAVWTPSASATDRAGNASTTTNATESGAADRNF